MSAENEAEIIVFPIRFEVDPQNIEDVSKAVEEATPAEGEDAVVEEGIKPEEKENYSQNKKTATL